MVVAVVVAVVVLLVLVLLVLIRMLLLLLILLVPILRYKASDTMKFYLNQEFGVRLTRDVPAS